MTLDKILNLYNVSNNGIIDQLKLYWLNLDNADKLVYGLVSAAVISTALYVTSTYISKHYTGRIADYDWTKYDMNQGL